MIRATNLPQRLANILAARGKSADFTKDVRCQDDSDGLPPRLAYWNAALLGPEPTQAEVDAVGEGPSAAVIDAKASLAIDATERLQFDVMFNHENRLRVLEGRQQVTQSVFRQALIDRWKQLNQ
jgi:hypothetical protein